MIAWRPGDMFKWWAMRRRPVTAKLTHRICTEPGVHRAACSARHAELWMLVNHLVEPDAELVSRPVIASSCAHCVWCGTLVAAPERCRLHDEACPQFNGLVTHHAIVAVARLKQLYRVRAMTPRGWAYFESAAQVLYDSGRLTAAELVSARVTSRSTGRRSSPTCSNELWPSPAAAHRRRPSTASTARLPLEQDVLGAWWDTYFSRPGGCARPPGQAARVVAE